MNKPALLNSLTSMLFLQPIAFTSLYQKRIWGGRALESHLKRVLPSSANVGESWDVTDRPEAESLVQSGGPVGTELHTLWRHHREALFGKRTPKAERFPLLIKLLDAREVLSVQVHPSGLETVPGLGEPKNEWWYILEAEPDAAVYAGFKNGVTRATLEKAMAEGTLEALLHRIPVKKGDSLYVPGGRCHAIGGGCLIAEIQQNSDTTFRMFDWNRLGPDGHPRELHTEKSLACVNVDDHQPSLDPPLRDNPFACEFFRVSQLEIREATRPAHAGGAFFLVLSGCVQVGDSQFGLGDWFLLPATAESLLIAPSKERRASLLQVNLP